MRIADKKEIKAFIKRCKNNLNSSSQNDFLDVYIDHKNEPALRQKLIKAGQKELLDNKVSLFIETEDFLKDDYYQHIKLDSIRTRHFSYGKEWIAGSYLFNSDVIIDDPDRELMDYMKLRALSDDYEAIFLYQGNDVWMMNAPSETYTNIPYAKKAKGKVLTFGLGIGYYAYNALINENVKSVTVIEKSKEVIEMFNRYIRPQFPKDKELTIIEGDAYKYFNKDYIDKFDYVYVDIWKSSIDGLKIIEKLLSSYSPDINKCDFWIFDSCIEILRTLILLHFDELVNNRKNKVTKEYENLMFKVRKYFRSIDKDIDNVEELKNYLYDRKTAREILAV